MALIADMLGADRELRLDLEYGDYLASNVERYKQNKWHTCGESRLDECYKYRNNFDINYV